MRLTPIVTTAVAAAAVRVRLVAPLMLACMLLAACRGADSGSDGPATDRPGASPVDTADVRSNDVAGGAVPDSCAGLHDTMLKVPATRESFAAEFGEPDSVISRTEPNRHVPGTVDSLFTVYYPGLTMDIRTPQGARDMAAHVSIADNRYLAWTGIGIGASGERVEAALGEPTDRDPASIVYDCSMGAEQPVTFRLSNGRVSAIEIAYYVD